MMGETFEMTEEEDDALLQQDGEIVRTILNDISLPFYQKVSITIYDANLMLNSF